MKEKAIRAFGIWARYGLVTIDKQRDKVSTQLVRPEDVNLDVGLDSLGGGSVLTLENASSKVLKRIKQAVRAEHVPLLWYRLLNENGAERTCKLDCRQAGSLSKCINAPYCPYGGYYHRECLPNSLKSDSLTCDRCLGVYSCDLKYLDRIYKAEAKDKSLFKTALIAYQLAKGLNFTLR